MFELATPWALLVLPLPVLVWALLPAYEQRRHSLQVPFFRRLVQLSRQEPKRGSVARQRLLFQRVWLLVSWLLLCLALAQPQWVGAPVVRTESARDLMVAVDLSGTMATADVPGPDGTFLRRIDAVKQVLGEFVANRPHDRLGLILFADACYLQAPFTADHSAWTALLSESEIGMAGYGTRFGDAIGLGIKVFDGSDRANKVMLVLTDGNDTSSLLPPLQAARVAAARGVRVYAIAIGNPETSGNEQVDLATLAEVTRSTGGVLFQATDAADLLAAHATIAALEPQTYETLEFRPRYPLHHWPMAVMLLGYLLFHSLMMVLAWWRGRAGASANPATAAATGGGT